MFRRIVGAIDAFTRVLGRVANVLSLALVVLVAADVALRYFFRISYVSVREMEWHIYALIFLLGGAPTLLHDAHVRVDVAYQHYSPRVKALVNMLGTLVFLIPGCWLVVRTSLPFVSYAMELGEVSPDPGGLTHRWLLKAMIPFAFSMLAIQGVSFFMRNLQAFLGQPVKQEI